MKRKLFFGILFLILALIFIQSCKKEDEYVPGSDYTIYLDKQNRYIKILEGTGIMYSFQYTDSTVIVTEHDYRQTYFINDLGLADSSLFEERRNEGPWIYPSMCYYKYSKDGYMEYNGQSNFWYKHAEGNRTEAVQDSLVPDHDRWEYYYTYTSLPNIIDLEYFSGPYLGKLNRNLISKLTYSAGNILKDATVEFSYILDSKNYVIKRTEIFTAAGMPTDKSIRTYNYIFEDQ